MSQDVVVLCLGLALLLAGGRALVDGASQLAKALGVSELTVGLTVVAFGTSAPELSVNALAAARGDAAIAFGNVIGSNVANVGLVLGLCALLRPLRIDSLIVTREIPMMLLATLATLVLGLDRIRGEAESYDRSDGLILLLLFSVFLYYSISAVTARQGGDPLAEGAAGRVRPSAFWTAGRAGLFAIVGLAVLLVGAQLTVSRAVSLAEALEVPRAVVGLTIVAVGTSLPELATSLVATWRGHANLAVGNVVGSNVFNLLFILAVTAAIRPVEVPRFGGSVDLAALLLFSGSLLPLSRLTGARILRWQGLLLVVAYFSYVIWRLSD